MTESLPSLSDFENILTDRIEDLRGRIHKAHNPIYAAKQRDVSIYLFPVFKEFNLLATLTAHSIVFFISSSNSGSPQVYWYGWRVKESLPNVDQLASFLQHRYDRAAVNILIFPVRKGILLNGIARVQSSHRHQQAV
jgi:hypothetical protein